MNRTAIILLLFFLAGCAMPAGRGSRLWPWNWGSPDRATQLEQRQRVTAAAEDAIVDEAHRDIAKAAQALALDPVPSKYVSEALRFARHAGGLLDQVRPLSLEVQRRDEQLVRDLLNENAEIRAAAAKRQSADEARADKLARELTNSRAAEADTTEKLKASDLRYQAEAENNRMLWFWVKVAVCLYLVVHYVVPCVAQGFPASTLLARLANTLKSATSAHL